MKKAILVCILTGFISLGCVTISSEDRAKISFQAARLDRAIALIDSDSVTQEEEIAFIRAERRVWHALNYSVNNVPLPPDMKPATAPGN